VKRLAALLLIATGLWAASFRLYLRDGGHHTVSEYKVEGDRVRYFSSERGDWEEIPLELVDLKKTESARAEREARLSADEKAQAEEDEAERALAREIRRVPQEFGIYLIDGEQLRKIEQAEVELVTDKKRSVLKAITPLPILTGKATFEIKGERSANATTEKRPEFYVRQETEQRLGILRMGPKKGVRVVEQVRIVPVTKEMVEEPDMVETFRRQFADNLFKIWPTKDLAPGEYGVVQYVEGKGNIQVWDFRVD
jgi:hypothetical protein